MGTKYTNKYLERGKGTVYGLEGKVKCSVWRFVKAGGNAPLDAMSYSEIACHHNRNINIFFISSEDIEKKSDEMSEHWHQILLMPNTVKLHCIKTQGPDKRSVSNVSNGEAFSIIGILPATDETLVSDVMFDQNFDRKNFSFGDWVLVKYNSTNYSGEILQIGNNGFQVNVMNKRGKFWR